MVAPSQGTVTSELTADGPSVLHALVLHVYYQGVNLVLTNFFSLLTQDVGVRKRERERRQNSR